MEPITWPVRGEASWFELTQTLYRKLGIQTPVRPVSSVAFSRIAVRPRYTVLTTIQAPADPAAPMGRRINGLYCCLAGK